MGPGGSQKMLDLTQPPDHRVRTHAAGLANLDITRADPYRDSNHGLLRSNES